MVNKTKLFSLPKFGSLEGSTSACLKIGRIFAIAKKNGRVLKLGVTLTSFYLVTDLLLNNYTNKIGFNATPA